MKLVQITKNVIMFTLVVLMFVSCGGGGSSSQVSDDPPQNEDPVKDDDGPLNPQENPEPDLSQITNTNAVDILANKVGYAVNIYNAYAIVFDTALKNNLIAGDDGVVVFRNRAKQSVNCESGIGTVDLKETSGTATFTNCVIGDKTIDGKYSVSEINNIADPESSFIEFLLADILLEDLSITNNGEQSTHNGLLDTSFTANRDTQVRGVDILAKEFQISSNGGESLSITNFDLHAGMFVNSNFEVIEIDYIIGDSSTGISHQVASETFFADFETNPDSGSLTVTDNTKNQIVANADNGDLATIQYTMDINGTTTSQVLSWEDSGLIDHFNTLRKLDGIIRVGKGKNQPDPVLNVVGTTITEGDSGTKNALFRVTLTRSSSATISVNYSTQDGTAKSGSDYEAKSGVLTFKPGMTSIDISVPIFGDTEDESHESFRVALTSPKNAKLGTSEATGTIEDDDDTVAVVPKISIKGVTVTEGNSGTKDAVFDVTLSESSSKKITVKYATKNGSAMSGSDYKSTSGTLTFDAGDKTEKIRVPIIGDTKAEDQEAFTVELSSPNNATLSNSKATGTIKDNDENNTPASDLTIQRGKSKSFRVSGTCNRSFSAGSVLYTPHGGAFSATFSATKRGSSYTFTIHVKASGNATIKVYNFSGEVGVHKDKSSAAACTKKFSKKISVVK